MDLSGAPSSRDEALEQAAEEWARRWAVRHVQDFIDGAQWERGQNEGLVNDAVLALTAENTHLEERLEQAEQQTVERIVRWMREDHHWDIDLDDARTALMGMADHIEKGVWRE